MYEARPRGQRVQQTTSNYILTTPQTVHAQHNWVDERTGQGYRWWRDAIAAHLSATTPFVGRFTTCEHVDGMMRIAGTDPGTGQYRFFEKSGWLEFTDFGAATAQSYMDGTAEMQAASKFYNEARSCLHALSGGELLGELGKTAKAIISTAKAMHRVVNAATQGLSAFKGQSWRTVASDVSSHYLAFKMGWDPLANDVNALLSDFELDNLEVEKFTCKGRSGANRSIAQGTGGLGVANYNINVDVTEEYTVRYICEIGVTRYGFGGLTERMGLSPNNWIPTIYNLLPWTYMIDYFTNLGDIVSAISFPTSAIRWVNRTVRNTVTTRVYCGGINDFSGWGGVTTIDKPSITTWKNTWVKRDAAFPPPIPDLQFRMPTTQTESGRGKWLNIAALLAARTFTGGLLRP